MWSEHAALDAVFGAGDVQQADNTSARQRTSPASGWLILTCHFNADCASPAQVLSPYTTLL